MSTKTKPPPGHLRILGRDFTVLSGSPDKLEEIFGSSVYGFCDVASRAIAFCDNMDAFDTKDTIVHEVFHAIRHTQGRENGGAVEEDYVRSLATGLIGVLQDNPAFAKWLLTPIKPP